MKKVSFVKGVPEFENPEIIPTLIVLDDLMETAYSTKVSQLFTKGSHHRNISLVLITQSLENISSFHKTYLDVCKDPHTYLFLDLTQSINDLLRFRTKKLPGESTEVFTPVRGNETVEVTATLPSRT